MLAERVQQWYREYEQKGLQAGLEKGLEQGLEQGLERGLEQGLAQGRTDEARRILLLLTERRFGGLAESITSRINEADLATLESWTDRVLDATTLEDIFR